jgi:hypothetical protein
MATRTSWETESSVNTMKRAMTIARARTILVLRPNTGSFFMFEIKAASGQGCQTIKYIPGKFSTDGLGLSPVRSRRLLANTGWLGRFFGGSLSFAFAIGLAFWQSVP